MKNIYSLFALSTFSFLFAQTYNPLVLSQNQWKSEFQMGIMAEPACSNLKISHTYFFTEEVDINGQTYLTLMKRYEPEALQKWNFIQQNCPGELNFNDLEGMNELEDILVGYLRDDSDEKKVYWIKQNETVENVLFDFSYNLGTNNIGNGYFVISSEVYEYNLNTQKNMYSFEAQNYNETIQGIGSIGDLILQWPSKYDSELQGFQLLGFSTDNGLTFYNKENQSLEVKEIQDLNSIKIYPNPTNQFINIQSDSPIQKISIYNLNGKNVSNHHSTKKIDVSNLASGTYLIKIELKNGIIQQQKFIKK